MRCISVCVCTRVCVCVCVIKEQCQQGGPVLERVTRASSRPSPTFGHYLPTSQIKASGLVCVYLCICMCVLVTELLQIIQFMHVCVTIVQHIV